MAEDRRLRKDLDVPKKTSNRLTQDSLAVKYDAAHTPLLPGWVGSDGQPPNKGRRMVDVDISNRAGAVGGFSSDGSFAIAQKRHFGSDPKRYHRHFDDGDEFGDGLVPQEHARHYREGVVRARRPLLSAVSCAASLAPYAIAATRHAFYLRRPAGNPPDTSTATTATATTSGRRSFAPASLSDAIDATP